MAKIKKDIIVFGETYKNIDVYEYRTPYDVSIYIDTTGIAQIIKQYIKNKYGDIKVWAKSSKYSMGSSVSVYLWNVPREWFLDIKEFADRFGKYIDYSSGDPDGNFYGKNVNATLIDGTKIENDSPYIRVDNKPPYDSKEYDMTPPNYEDMPKTTKKEYQRKGGKYSPTDNLDLVLDCGNGWKIYVGKPKEKYLYNVVKDKDTKQNKEQWAEIKADMLEAGFMWGYKSGTFQRWTTMPDDTIPQKACDVLSKYWGGASQPKAENPKQPQVMIPQGTEFELMEDDGTLKKGDTGVFAQDYYPPNTYVDAYMNSERVPDFLYYIPFKKIRIIEEAPKEETPKETKKFKVGDIVEYIGIDLITIKNGDIGIIDSIPNKDNYDVKFYKPSIGYSFGNIDKDDLELVESKKEFKVGDKVKLIKDITNYKNNQGIKLGDIGIVKNKEGYLDNYDVEFNGKEIYLDVSYFEIVESASTKEVNLEEYISDLNVLLEMEDDESKRLELATYISDLNILKLLD